VSSLAAALVNLHCVSTPCFRKKLCQCYFF